MKNVIKKKFNKEVIPIIFLIAFLLVICLGYIYYEYPEYKRNRQMKNYEQDVMRFDLHLNQGQYEIIPSKDFWERTHLYNDEQAEIQKQTTIIYTDTIDLKFSEYVLTKDAEYMKTNINGIDGWIKEAIPILNEDDKVFIRKFIYQYRALGANSISVFPFNDSNFVLIYSEGGQYILDLGNKEVTWYGGGYYESTKVDIYSDTIYCGGDLSSKTYYFNKYGEKLNRRLQVKNKES